MFSKAISFGVVASLLLGGVAAQTQPQSPSQSLTEMQQVLRRAQEKGKAVKVKLIKKTDHQSKFTGQVSEVSDTGFALIDRKTGKTMKLAYDDVQEVKQTGMSKGTKIALVVVGGAVIGAVAVLQSVTD